MGLSLKVGDRLVNDAELFPLLAQYQMLPQLAREIVIEKAIKEIDCTIEEKDIAKQQFYQQHQITKEEHVQAWREARGINQEQLELIIVKGIKLEKFKETNWGEQIESYFVKRKPQLDQVVYSLIRNQDAGIIQELYFRLQEKENSFADLAREYSQGAEAQTGGLIGPVELSSPHPKIAQMLNVSKPGQIWPPTRVGDWLVIVRLEKFLTAQLDEQMRQRLLEELFQAWLRETMQETVSFVEAQT